MPYFFDEWEMNKQNEKTEQCKSKFCYIRHIQHSANLLVLIYSHQSLESINALKPKYNVNATIEAQILVETQIQRLKRYA